MTISAARTICRKHSPGSSDQWHGIAAVVTAARWRRRQWRHRGRCCRCFWCSLFIVIVCPAVATAAATGSVFSTTTATPLPTVIVITVAVVVVVIIVVVPSPSSTMTQCLCFLLRHCRCLRRLMAAVSAVDVVSVSAAVYHSPATMVTTCCFAKERLF